MTRPARKMKQQCSALETQVNKLKIALLLWPFARVANPARRGKICQKTLRKSSPPPPEQKWSRGSFLEPCHVFKVISSHLTEILCHLLSICACRTLLTPFVWFSSVLTNTMGRGTYFFYSNMSFRTFLHARKCGKEEQWQCACALQLARFA